MINLFNLSCSIFVGLMKYIAVVVVGSLILCSPTAAFFPSSLSFFLCLPAIVA